MVQKAVEAHLLKGILIEEFIRNHRNKYDFLLNIIRPRKRYSKWLKKSKNDNIDLIKKFYGYSYTKAKDVVDILSEDQIEHIRSKLDTGGLRKE